MKRVHLLLAALAITYFMTSAPAKASTSFPAVGQGDAYAALVTLNTGGPTKILAGPIAPASLACNVITSNKMNDAASINFGAALSTGTATDTVASMHSSSGASMKSTSTVQGVSALGGLITATTVEAVANSAASSAGSSSNGTGSMFVNLVVAGVPISGTPAPNTTIALPGIGSVVLNEQTLENDASTTSIDVNLIHIRVTKSNSLGLQIGTNIIVAHAVSRITVSASATGVDADAYGLLLKLHADDLDAGTGRYAPATINCTAGYDRDRIVSISSPIGTTGVVVDTADGHVTASGGSAEGISDIENARFLGGLIVAASIKSFSQVQLTTSGSRMGSTTLTHAEIAGVALSLHPAPNTRINIANLGYAILNEQSGSMDATGATQQVNAIHVFVTDANSFHLPINSSIIIGHSRAEVTAF